jgi:hypothetical protein
MERGFLSRSDLKQLMMTKLRTKGEEQEMGERLIAGWMFQDVLVSCS